MDVDNFLRFWAVESMLGFWDGYTANQNNYYLYFDPEKERGYFIPWGADSLFTDRSPFGGGFGNRGGATAVNGQSILANRLYRAEGIPERYRDTMKELLEAGVVIDLAEEVSRLERAIAKLDKEIEKLDRKLANERFVAKAPAEVVAEQRARLAETQAARTTYADNLAQLR